MKKYFKKILFVGLLCTSTQSFALSGPVDIQMMYVAPRAVNEGVFVHFTQAVGGCDYPDKVILLKSHSMFNQYYSILLSAQMSKTKLRYSTSGCHGGGGVNFPILYDLRIYESDQT